VSIGEAIEEEAKSEGMAKKPWEMSSAEFDKEFIFHGSKKKGLSELQQGTYYSPWGKSARDFIDTKWYEANKGSVYGVRKSQIKETVAPEEDIFGQEWIKQGLAKRSGEKHTPEFEITAKEAAENAHKAVIKKALAEGKSVTEDVLAEYPDLKKPKVTKGKPAEEAAPAIPEKETFESGLTK